MVVLATSLSLGAAVNVVASGVAEAKGVPTALYGVSCPTTSRCIAVGTTVTANYYRKTLVRSWNGTSWSTIASPNPSTAVDSSLSGVSCVSTTSCVAVGSFYDNTTSNTLIESWNGTNWSIITSPPITNSTDSLLAGVSCISTSSCTAVGQYWDGSMYRALIESWNGTTWSTVASPTGTGIGSTYLSGVSCISTTFCTAVGTYFDGNNYPALIESWNGTNWSIATSPPASTSIDSGLFGVSCISISSCTAVGSYDDGTTQKALIESWNGTTWSTVTSLNNANSTSNILTAVSCVAATWCTATGFVYPNGADQSLIESWDGTTWSVLGSPNFQTAFEGDLLGIACNSPTTCVVTGYTIQPQNYFASIAYFAPLAPSTLKVVGGTGKATISWSSPDGVDTRYTATASPGGAHCSSTSTSCVLTGLAAGKTYSISVTATNAVGSATSATPVSVTLSVPLARAELAATGSNVWVLIEGALLLLGLGLITVWKRRNVSI